MYWIYGIQYNDLHNQDEIQVVRWILTHWGRVTHICISRLTITGSDNGLSPGRRQAIIWTNAGILLIGPIRNKLQWKFNRNSNIFIHENAFESVVCEMAAILSRPQCDNGVIRMWEAPCHHHPLSQKWCWQNWLHNELSKCQLKSCHFDN